MNRYNTRSNKVRVVKTPGGALRYLHIKKAGTAPKCGDCGIKLPGVSGLYLCFESCVEKGMVNLGREWTMLWFGNGCHMTLQSTVIHLGERVVQERGGDTDVWLATFPTWTSSMFLDAKARD